MVWTLQLTSKLYCHRNGGNWCFVCSPKKGKLLTSGVNSQGFSMGQWLPSSTPQSWWSLDGTWTQRISTEIFVLGKHSHSKEHLGLELGGVTGSHLWWLPDNRAGGFFSDKISQGISLRTLETCRILGAIWKRGRSTLRVSLKFMPIKKKKFKPVQVLLINRKQKRQCLQPKYSRVHHTYAIISWPSVRKILNKDFHRQQLSSQLTLWIATSEVSVGEHSQEAPSWSGVGYDRPGKGNVAQE